MRMSSGKFAGETPALLKANSGNPLLADRQVRVAAGKLRPAMTEINSKTDPSRGPLSSFVRAGGMTTLGRQSGSFGLQGR
jgi:hypothetical protein